VSTITSANSAFAIVILGLYNAPQLLQGYAADDMFTADALDSAEIVMGADGIMSAGYVFNPVKQTITIMPDSPSLDVFDNWRTAEQTLRDKLFANATIRLPSIGKVYTLTKGVLTSSKPLPDAKKTLQALPYVVTWQSVVGSPI
jgi:hypothetical protein